MNDDISALYRSSSQLQNLMNESASTLLENLAISSAIASRPWRTMSSLPSSYTARYIGSTFLMVTKSAMLAPAATKASSNSPGIVSTVGPLSKRKPCESMTPARPPGISSRSSSVTLWPLRDKYAAEERPPRPAPITTTCIGLLMLVGRSRNVQVLRDDYAPTDQLLRL